MRIIGGLMRGTKLYTLEGENTRPTLDRVKESLFNILNFKLQDAVVLDLFSGSGALGLESISRGARKAILCDASKAAYKIILSNVEKTRVNEKVKVYNIDYEKCLTMLANEKYKFDVIFLDPPYESEYYEKSLEKIYNLDLLDEIVQKLPDELKTAKWIKEERERIIAEAHQDADNIVKEAENRIISMIDEHEITKKAYDKKSEIIAGANEMYREVKEETARYADEILANVENDIIKLSETVAGIENSIQGALEILKNNRNELK